MIIQRNGMNIKYTLTLHVWMDEAKIYCYYKMIWIIINNNLYIASKISYYVFHNDEGAGGDVWCPVLVAKPTNRV